MNNNLIIKNKIILVGIPGSGKSKLGQQLANRLKLPFFDTDDLMIKKANLKNFADFTRIAFNGQFITIQKRIMYELSNKRDEAVVSTGAEVALIPECAYIMKKMGTIIHIKRDPEIIYADSINKKDNLVIERDGVKIDKYKEILKLYMEEYSKYEAIASLTLENNGTEDEGLEKLAGLLYNNNGGGQWQSK